MSKLILKEKRVYFSVVHRSATLRSIPWKLTKDACQAHPSCLVRNCLLGFPGELLALFRFEKHLLRLYTNE